MATFEDELDHTVQEALARKNEREEEDARLSSQWEQRKKTIAEIFGQAVVVLRRHSIDASWKKEDGAIYLWHLAQDHLCFEWNEDERRVKCSSSFDDLDEPYAMQRFGRAVVEAKVRAFAAAIIDK